MSSWQIFSDAGNNFRWEISDQQLCIKPDEEPTVPPIQRPDSTHRLPSMADLLLQGCSKLMESCGGDVESAPMFRSGLGKSVTVKHSSISKALSILGDEGDDFANIGQLCRGRDNGFSSSNSMFQTGSGKTVNISFAGLVRAKTLLGLEENYNQENLQGLQQTRNQLTACEPSGRRNLSRLGTKEEVNSESTIAASEPIPPFSPLGSDSKREDIPELMHSAATPPPIKFHTASGRSISVSTDALKRARSLLGDLELGTFSNNGDANDPIFSFGEGGCQDVFLNKENNLFTSFSNQEMPQSKHMSKSFTSSLRLSSTGMQSSVMSKNIVLGSNLIKKFDAEEDCDNSLYRNTPSPQKPLNRRPQVPHAVLGNPPANGIGSRINPRGRSFSGPLTDISNNINMDSRDKSHTGEKRRFGMRSSVSPFKRPRSSKFVTPLNNKISLVPNGLSTFVPEESNCKRKVSTRYPIQVPRTYLKEYFGLPTSHQSKLEQLPDHVRKMNPANAEKYVFSDGSGLNCIGAEDFHLMLAQCGAFKQYASKEWVANHYKWIVWKLACYERCYPSKSSGKLLTVSNVLEELKYRYEREANHGHRSAIKRILEGDVMPSSMMVLCISSVHSIGDPEIETQSITANGAENGSATKIELTDGWYSVTALLDIRLSKELAAGKLFVGEKLRIWGAGLSGWDGPVSPLEASRMVGLVLHINGTYRVHWADRLGLCKGAGAPLAFRCIKANGGSVPCTLVGVTRIYPVLYRERLSDGGFIVRSERMEAKMMQLYNQRCSSVAEGIMSEFQKEFKDSNIINNDDSEEGAKILKILETAAEPEVLMAEMSSEQLTSFAAYQAKLEALRQSDMQKSIEKAFEDTGLSAREVTPFMRVRVVGLTSKRTLPKCCSQKGLITIWNPTEKHFELVEGQAYSIAGLTPLGADSDTLYLQARGSTTKWLPLPPSATEKFEPFFSPRVSVLLSNLGEVPLSSEFDIAAFVVYVGDVYTDAHQKKQWVFVTDGSTSKFRSEDISNSLLAISFCLPYNDVDSSAPINYNLVGSTVGFCNLIKRAKDQMNHIWVAGATENSTYFLSYDSAHCSHMKDAAASAQRWAKVTSSKIEKLKENVVSIIGNCGG